MIAKWYAPSWLDAVECQSAVKWRMTNEQELWKIKRLGYSLIFKGLDQLEQSGKNSILHYWFERDRAVGNRRKELLHFFETLKKRNKFNFSWIIFNEVSPSLSRYGRFDFIEYCHPISGGYRKTEHAPVTNVFVADGDMADDISEFGVGHSLLSVDDDDESWKRKNKK